MVRIKVVDKDCGPDEHHVYLVWDIQIIEGATKFLIYDCNEWKWADASLFRPAFYQI